MAPGPFQTFRKHPKTSSFALTAGFTAIYLSYDYSVTNDMMKHTCRKAAALGDKPLDSHSRPRHVTVILNPVAGKRQSKKLYTKWVEPIMHLAGVKVSLIETERPNQAYDLMKIMSNCDAVAIVGGDGTVHEALNGLLDRPDCSKASKDFPIAIMPTGQYNSIARYIHQRLSYRNQKEFLIQATSRLVDSVKETHDVLKITPLKEEETKEETLLNNKAIYALRDVRYGKHQDDFFKVSGWMFYQTNIRPYWVRVKKIFTNKCPIPQIDSIKYTEPCEGCSRCYDKHLLKSTMSVEEEKQKPSANRKWWNFLAPAAKPEPSKEELEEQRELELSKRDNPNCDKWNQVEFPNEITDFRACMMGDKKVRLSLARHGEHALTEIRETQDVRLKVSSELDNEKLLVSQKKLEQADSSKDENKDVEGDEKRRKQEEENDKSIKFLIDGQPNQAHSLEITTLRKAVTIFTGPLKFY